MLFEKMEFIAKADCGEMFTRWQTGGESPRVVITRFPQCDSVGFKSLTLNARVEEGSTVTIGAEGVLSRHYAKMLAKDIVKEYHEYRMETSYPSKGEAKFEKWYKKRFKPTFEYDVEVDSHGDWCVIYGNYCEVYRYWKEQERWERLH
tara:strand:- start:480 stop:923 length:444 start_codon:yes stop_codon:yes gene_type:complete